MSSPIISELYSTANNLAKKRELLAAVNEAIKNLLLSGAQSYTIGRRSLTRINLTELYKLRKLLQDEIAVEDTPPGLLASTRVSVFDRR